MIFMFAECGISGAANFAGAPWACTANLLVPSLSVNSAFNSQGISGSLAVQQIANPIPSMVVA